MQSSPEVSIATTALTVLFLVFGGFATILYKIFEADSKTLSPNHPIVLSWVFMSYSISLIFPAFLYCLDILSDSGEGSASAVLLLLGVFISTPVVLLSAINVSTSFSNNGDVEWRLYQRVVNGVSGSVIILTALVYLIYILSAPPSQAPHEWLLQAISSCF